MRAALDSNILIYAEGLADDWRCAKAFSLIEAIPEQNLLIPLQVAGETLQWLIRRAKVPKAEAVRRILNWTERFTTQATTAEIWERATELISKHDFQVWDAVILSASAEAGATILLSEDMQDGFRWRGVTIVNPFVETPHPLLLKTLNS